MSNEDIRTYLLNSYNTKVLPEKIQEYLYVEPDECGDLILFNQKNRVLKLLEIIIIERFIKREI